MSSILKATIFVALFALMAADAFAQRGSVRGKLVDEDGNGVEGVECVIELKDEGGRALSATSKDDGQFVKGGFKPGDYIITCEKEGFRKLTLATRISSFDQTNLGEHVFYRLAPGELSESQHERATELLEKFQMSASGDDHKATLASLFELEKMLPDNPELTFNIASTYEKMGDDVNALKYYGKTVELKPDFYDAWAAAGDIHGRRQEWAEAAANSKQAIELKATDPILMFNYGVYAQNAGDVEAAEAAYEKTLALDPNRPLAHYQLGLISVSKGENDAAIAHFEKFLQLEPDHPQAAAAQGVIDALKAKGSQ